jgi:hypothetical protein
VAIVLEEPTKLLHVRLEWLELRDTPPEGSECGPDSEHNGRVSGTDAMRRRFYWGRDG